MLFGGVPAGGSTVNMRFQPIHESRLNIYANANITLFSFVFQSSHRSALVYCLATAALNIRHALRDLLNRKKGHQIFRLSYEQAYQTIEATYQNSSKQPTTEFFFWLGERGKCVMHRSARRHHV